MNSINNEKQEGEKTYPFARWVSWLFLVASVLLLIYTYYRAEIVYRGINEIIYFKYYLISLVGVLFWGVVLRLREGVRANIVTVVITLVIGLYMVEGGLTLLGPGQSNNPVAVAVAAAELGVEYDQRTKLEVIEDLIAEGVDAVPTVYPAILVEDIGTNKKDIGELFPLAGVSNKITIYSNESGKYLIYKSDRHGFNNPDSQWDVRTSELEWLLTGDSFTHGAAVQPGQEISAQIRYITNNTAISLGIGGNSPLVEYAALVEYGKELSPAKVLWIYFEGNDLVGDLSRDKSNPLLMQYMQDEFSQNLINRQKEVDSRLRKYFISAQAQAQALMDRAKWMKLHMIRSVISFDKIYVDVDVDVDDPLFTKILTKAKAKVDGWGGELYFVYLPEILRYKDKRVVSHDDFRRKSEVINLVKGLKIPVIDIHQEVFSGYADPLSLFPLRLGVHYNADGYEEVAKAIVGGVKKHEDQNRK